MHVKKCLKEHQCFHQIDPEEEGEEGKDRTQHNQLSGKLSVSAHVLCHWIGGGRYRCGINHDQQEKLHSFQVKEQTESQHKSRKQEHFDAEDAADAFPVFTDSGKMQSCTQNKEGKR